MSEHQPKQNPEDELFDNLVKDLAGDAEFSDTIEQLSGKMSLIEMGMPTPTYESDLKRYAKPHSERPLGIRDYLVDVFNEVCEDYSVDPNSMQAPEKYSEIGDIMAAEMYGLKKELYSGDVIAVTNTMVVDIAGTQEGEGLRVLAIPEGIKIVGTFSTTVIAPMPDEVNAVILDNSSPPAIGVGLLISSPVVMGRNGEVNTDIFAGRSVIVSLSPATIELSKYHFETDIAD